MSMPSSETMSRDTHHGGVEAAVEVDVSGSGSGADEVGERGKLLVKSLRYKVSTSQLGADGRYKKVNDAP